MEEQQLRALKPELDRFLERHAAGFGREQNAAHGRVFVQGLLRGGDRRNAENVAEALDGPPVRTLQVFLASGAWQDADVLDQMRQDLLAARSDADAVLNVDATGFPKKGTKSVGVKRQYSGTLGRTDNCQIGVFVNYGSSKGHAFWDRRLYLPEEWADDPARRTEAGVPSAVIFRTKPQLALEMVANAVASGVAVRWVGGDSVYGTSPTFVQGVRALGPWYVLDSSAEARVWTAEPRVIPAADRPAPKRGRRSTQPDVVGESRRVDEVAAGLPARAWRRVQVGDGSQGHPPDGRLRQRGHDFVHPPRRADDSRLGAGPPPLSGPRPPLGRNHLRLVRPHPRIRGRVHHVPLAQFPNALHVGRAIPVHAVAPDPPERHACGHGVGDHRQAQLRLGAEHDGRRDARRGPPIRVGGPLLGQEQPPVQEGVSVGRAVVQEHPDLAVVGSAQRARVLPLHPDRLVPLLREPGLAHVQHRVVVGQRGEQVVPHPGHDGRVVPRPGREEHLEGADGWPVEGLGDVLDVPPVPAAEQPLHEHPAVGAVLLAAEERGVGVEKAVQFGLEGPQFLRVHDRLLGLNVKREPTLYRKL